MRPQIHLSIDDVWISFYQLFKDRPNSIFGISLFKKLLLYHKKYNATFTLYVVGKTETFDLRGCDNSYKDEFEKNSDWLRFALHCVTLSNNSVTAMQRYLDYDHVLQSVVGENCISPIVRLHSFQKGALLNEELKEAGIKNLLCADDDRISYCMSREDDWALREQGILEKSGMTYIPTKIRMENGYSLSQVIDTNRSPFISAFTHEYYFYGKRFLFGRIMMARFLRVCKIIKVQYTR